MMNAGNEAVVTGPVADPTGGGHPCEQAPIGGWTPALAYHVCDAFTQSVGSWLTAPASPALKITARVFASSSQIAPFVPSVSPHEPMPLFKAGLARKPSSPGSHSVCSFVRRNDRNAP